MLLTVLFLIALTTTVQVTNMRSSAEMSDDNLSFSHQDSLIIFVCVLSTFLIDFLAKHLFSHQYIVIDLVATGFYTMILVIVNNNREQRIKQKHDEILNVYTSLADILGRVDPEEIDFANIPFELTYDSKTGKMCQIVVDTSNPNGRFNENAITLTQYNMNKFFPDYQWMTKLDRPKRELTFKGLPKPPKIAKWKGSDYRPAGWIPLGLSGEGEVGWNIADPKDADIGISSYVTEEGKTVNTVPMPSSPQCMTLGSPLALDTIVPLATGKYKLLKDIEVGDYVFDK